jgi:hypothetical protein
MSCTLNLLPVFAIVFALHAAVLRPVASRLSVPRQWGWVWALVPAIVALPVWVDWVRPAACAPEGVLLTWLTIVAAIAVSGFYLVARTRANLAFDRPMEPMSEDQLARAEFRGAFMGPSDGHGPAVFALLLSAPVAGAAIGAVWLGLGSPGVRRR